MTVSSLRSISRLYSHVHPTLPSIQTLSTPTQPMVTTVRGFRQVKEHKVAVVTGASRGIGYATAIELCSKLASANIYLTTRGETDHLNALIKEELGEKADMVNFHTMEVTNIDSMVDFRNMIHAKHGKIDLLINNAGQYFEPSPVPSEHFRQVEKTLATNYWGMKNVCKAFLPMLTQTARIVNLSSHLGHLSLIPGAAVQKQLGDPHLSEQELDSLILQFQDHCTEFKNDFAEAGWPACAYTVSKVAVNAYTRILQRQLEEDGEHDHVVVNAIHPGSKHSKISQESPLTAADAAKAVICTALLADPCEHPRGKFIWHDLQIIQWDQGNLKGMWA